MLAAIQRSFPTPWLTTLAGFEVQWCIVIGGFSEPMQMASVVREHYWGWQRLGASLQGSWQHRIHVPSVPCACTPASQTPTSQPDTHQPDRHAPDKLSGDEMVSPKSVTSSGWENPWVRDKRAFWESFISCFNVASWTCFKVVCSTASGVLASEKHLAGSPQVACSGSYLIVQTLLYLLAPLW